jgi:hypothetical protein
MNQVHITFNVLESIEQALGPNSFYTCEDVGKLIPYLEQAARYIDVKTYTS